MTAANTPIDHAAIRERYAIERDKRLRPDGADQYLEPSGRFAALADDPWIEDVERDPVTDDVTVALIGGGFAGLGTGARLHEAGLTDVRIIDGAGDVGGVWYWNRYPGAMCDTAAMVYLPLLEQTGHMPSKKYVYGDEIFEHAQRIAKTFGLYDNALFSTEVKTLEWDDVSSRWLIETDRGDRLRARFVAMGTGPMTRPKLPGIPGIESFGGHTFHTARWDYDYTGGDRAGAPMENLATKRVGIIGTGATAVQCIPPLARDSGGLFVFQRTPSSIDVRNNHPIDPDEFADLQPGWQHEWLMNFATLQMAGFADEDLVKDGWTDIAKRIRDRIIVEMSKPGAVAGPELMQRAYFDCDDEKMEEIRARVDEIVEDPATADGLKPWYRQLCKRPCFHDEYLQSYNISTNHLIDTDGRGVERIDETGVWANGVHYELDCLVFASGFEVHLSHTADYETVGRDGIPLSEHWRDGMRTMHGVHARGFPNLFIEGLSQGARLISNITHNLDETGQSIAAIIDRALTTDTIQVEVSAEAEQEWMDILDSGEGSLLGSADCTPGYYNNEGQEPTVSDLRNAAGYPDGPAAFFDYIDAWRRSGQFEGLDFRTA
ncbi:MAG: NAD(P)/FAD-dependent oxidoreductase [Acidimicrobiia bacterium]|nr:NAD(P)/FAD-dependent oxidoreductase [Acidimicrobiia bacterium]